MEVVAGVDSHKATFCRSDGGSHRPAGRGRGVRKRARRIRGVPCLGEIARRDRAHRSGVLGAVGLPGSRTI